MYTRWEGERFITFSPLSPDSIQRILKNMQYEKGDN